MVYDRPKGLASAIDGFSGNMAVARDSEEIEANILYDVFELSPAPAELTIINMRRLLSADLLTSLC